MPLKLTAPPLIKLIVIGDDEVKVGEPTGVTVKLFVLLSVKYAEEESASNNNEVCVPVIAALGLPLMLALCVIVNGLVGGVKLLV